MKGGISYIAKRHSKASNKYIKCYDSSEESKYIMNLSANNLSGYAMKQYLPYSELKRLNQKEISRFCSNTIEENGTLIEPLNLNYPGNLHELHGDYPLAPEQLEISQNMWSKYCSNIANYYWIKIGGVNKLVPNLGNKSKYALHYRNLKLY